MSDHLPIITKLAIESLSLDPVKQLSTQYQWNTLTRQQIADSYGNRVRALSNNIPVPDPTGATSADLDAYYASIVKVLRDACDETIPKSRFSPFLKPRWKSDIAPLHAEMRLRRRAWIAGNRPQHRDSPLFHEYKNAKRVFRSKLRNIYISLEREFYASVDEAACVDQNLFWSLINRKRKKKGLPSLELSVNEIIYREPAEKLKVWAEYFSDMYSPSEGNEKYDNDHLSRIKIAVNDMAHKSLHNNSSILDRFISEDEISSAVKTLKTKKSPGCDLIANEHILFAGDALTRHLARFFNLCLKLEHFPMNALYGVIVPLPKAGKQRVSQLKDDRGITLLTCLYKLFEKIVLERFRRFSVNTTVELSHSLQFAYKRKLCSVMTSFTLQETINHFIERNSVAFCCFLDASSAFDSVCHDGPFFKLFKMGINGKMWRVLRSIYLNMNSCVSFDGLKSDWFPIKRSVRQGGVLSAWLYIIYVNDLLVALENRSIGANINNVFYCSPMQADDLALIALCKNDLEEMINICYDYSRKWRYTLNPTKTVVTVFGESSSRFSKMKSKRKWFLGSIYEQPWYKHVGILRYANQRSVERTLISCRKLRGTFISIVGVGLHPQSMNPLTGRKIYERIVLALIGNYTIRTVRRFPLLFINLTKPFVINYRSAACFVPW